MNFNGRVDKPSVKNFQLIDEEDGIVNFIKKIPFCYSSAEWGMISSHLISLGLSPPYRPSESHSPVSTIKLPVND